MKYSLLFFIVLASCSKSVETAPQQKSNTTLESNYLTKDLDGTVLTISMVPVVTCYSYKDGEIPKPCDIFIVITCKLSNPIGKWIKVELLKNTHQEKYNLPDRADESLVLVIAPNQTQVSFKTQFSNKGNITVPDVFRIVDAAVFTLLD